MLRKLVLAICFIGTASAICLGTALFLLPKPPLLEDIQFGKCVLDKDGRLIRLTLAPDEKYRLPVRMEEIPPYAMDALVEYEDQFFHSHPGINPFSMIRSLGSLLGVGRKVGASTLTMQLARLKGRLRSNSLAGKCKQIWQALLLERHYSKNEILQAYFTLAPYGGNIEGIGAAARIYFNKAPANLTPLEIQALTVIPQNPVKRNPITGPKFTEARNILSFLLNGRKESLPPLAIRKPGDIPALAPHLATELAACKKAPTINTTLDSQLQQMTEKVIKNFVERGHRYNIFNAAALIINADNMHVEAAVGSADFHNEQISGQVDGTRARRSPGSTLKPFIYALALDQGLIHPATILPDSPRSFGGYDPENFDNGFRGPIAAGEALRSSRNLPAILLAERLKTPDLFTFLESAGIGFPQGPEYYGLALALGGAEISMREMGSLYAILLNQGLWQPLKFTQDKGEASPRRLLSREAAWLVLQMLERPECMIKNRSRKLPYRYKTGTSNGMRDAWTAGTLGNYVIITWVGNFDNSANPLFVGAKTALPLFQEIATSLSATKDLTDRHASIFAELNLDKAQVCRSTGDFAAGQCSDTIETIFIPGVSPVRDSGILRPILLDEATGLRSCNQAQGKKRQVYWEFWPSDLKKIFASAGIHKPDPPDWLPDCTNTKLPSLSPAPRILLPKKNVTYYRQVSDRVFKIPLLAAADSEAGTIHWYADSAYIGKSMPGEILFWQPAASTGAEILAVDENGNTSRVKCRLGVVHNDNLKN